MKELSQSKITSHVEYLAVIKFLYRYEKDLMFMLLLLKINYSWKRKIVFIYWNFEMYHVDRLKMWECDKYKCEKSPNNW